MPNLPEVPIKALIGGVLALALIIVLVILLVAVLGQAESPGQTETLRMSNSGVGAQAILGPLQPHLFLIPNPEKDFTSLQLMPFRPLGSPWSQQEIEPFWLDPLEIGLEQVKNDNRKLVQDLYKSIP